MLNSKGQVTIPKAIREELGLKPKTKLLVYTYKNAIILKKLIHDVSEGELKAALGS